MLKGGTLKEQAEALSQEIQEYYKSNGMEAVLEKYGKGLTSDVYPYYFEYIAEAGGDVMPFFGFNEPKPIAPKIEPYTRPSSSLVMAGKEAGLKISDYSTLSKGGTSERTTYRTTTMEPEQLGDVISPSIHVLPVMPIKKGSRFVIPLVKPESVPSTRTIGVPSIKTVTQPQISPIVKPSVAPESIPAIEPLAVPVVAPSPEPSPEPITEPSPETLPEPVPEPMPKAIPQPEPIPMPTPIPQPTPAEITEQSAIQPISRKGYKDEDEDKKPKQKEEGELLPGSVAWKMGVIYHTIEKPYIEVKSSPYPPKGFVNPDIAGEGSAKKSLQFIGGVPNFKQKIVDLGATKVRITIVGGKPEMEVVQSQKANIGSNIEKYRQRREQKALEQSRVVYPGSDFVIMHKVAKHRKVKKPNYNTFRGLR
jgi:hypothetical protein